MAEELELQQEEIVEEAANTDEVILEEFEEDDLLDFYYLKATNGLSKIDKMEFPTYFYDVIGSGDNVFYQKNITETKFFDEDWVKTLEGFFPSIDKIIKNPKLSIRYEEEVVAIEKAKKTNSASVRHLASHTQLIKEIDKNGDVRPKKILNTFAEEEIATYENRFIMTLINRLFYFVRARHEIIRDNVESFQKDHLSYESNFDIKDENVSFKIDINIKRDLDNDKINKRNHDLLARVERLSTYVSGFKNSQFMRQMGKAKKVHPPIMKTNVILKNPDFKNAYSLWLYLDRYNALDFDVDVRERPVKLSAEFKKNLDRISALSYAALVKNKIKRQEDFRVIEQVEPIIKKSTRIVKTHPEDVMKRPDAIEVEDNFVNEYYLQANKKIVTQQMKDMMSERLSKDASAKKVIKDALGITNSLFDTVFEIEENIDYFEKYINEDDPIKKYDDAKFKVKVAKIIREAKETDYTKSIKLEKSLYQTMLKATNAKLRKVNEQKKKEAYAKFEKQLEKDAKALQKEKARIKELIKKLDGKIVDKETGKEQIVLEKEQFEENLKNEITAFNDKAKAELKAEIDKMKAEHKEDVSKQKAEMKKSLKDAEERKALREKKMQERHDSLMQKEKDKALATKEKEVNKKLEIYNAELEELKAKKEEVALQVMKIDGKVVNPETGKDDLTVEKEEFNEKVKRDKAVIKAAIEDETQLELEKIKAAHEERMAKLKPEYEQKIQAAIVRREERIVKWNEKYKTELQKEEEKGFDKKAKTLESAKEKAEKEEKALKAKYQKELRELNEPLTATVEVEGENGELVDTLVVEKVEGADNE